MIKVERRVLVKKLGRHARLKRAIGGLNRKKATIVQLMKGCAHNITAANVTREGIQEKKKKKCC